MIAVVLVVVALVVVFVVITTTSLQLLFRSPSLGLSNTGLCGSDGALLGVKRRKLLPLGRSSLGPVATPIEGNKLSKWARVSD